MKVSRKTNYALLMLLDLAMHRGEDVVRLGDIARRQRIPPKFLEQIVLVLKRAGIVGSRRGPKGGYFLLATPACVTLAAILRLTEGGGWELAAEGVSEGPFDEVWQDISCYTLAKLEKTTLQHMAERALAMEVDQPREYVI